MKTLYFDIDGTVLVDDEEMVKTELAGGEFETAVRAAGFEAVICVGNFCAIAHAIRSMGIEYDGVGVLYSLCRGAFTDEAWLRASTVLIEDPVHRAEYIEYTGDWWYVDDLARHYMEKAGRVEVFTKYIGHRICAPDPKGSGRDIKEWLRASAF